MIDDADAIQDLSSVTTAPTTPTRTERDDEETDAATETQTLAPPKPKAKKPKKAKKAKKPRAVEGGVRKAKPKHRKVDELEGASLVSLPAMRRALRKIHHGPMQAGFFLFATAVSDSLLESMMADLQTICARTQAPMIKRSHVAELLSMFPYSTLFSDIRLMDNLADLAKKGPSSAGNVLFTQNFGSAVLPHIKRKRKPRVVPAALTAQVAN